MKRVFLGLILFFSLSVSAQVKAKEVLFSVDQKSYYTDEFVRVYNKNLDLVKDESQKDLNQYLELFIGYKLKVNKANKLGLQNGKQYLTELDNYRTQLAKNYLTDSKVTDALIEEGYNRMKKEINASHILIMVDENAAPADTLAAYQKITEIRNRVLKGEEFGKLAQEVSQDPSAKDNLGNLGYFTSFRMVYTFESAAFKTQLNEVSQPVRTRFGYHIIKVNDIRDNRGEILVAHIMLMNPKEGETKTAEEVQKTIQDIYKKIQQGEKFDELAQQFSEDKSTSGKGGELSRFASGQLSSIEFENQAFSLSKENPISKPFQTQFGWHIVKFIDKFPLQSLKDLRAELDSKISKDERSRIIEKSMNTKLRKKYTINKDKKMIASVNKQVTDLFYDSKWELPKDSVAFSSKLFTINTTEISGYSFLKYIKNQEKRAVSIKPITKLTSVLLEDFVDEQLNKYNNDNLENEHPEFAAVMEEYRDGLLLFELMEKEIWQRAKTDTIGLTSFYETVKNNHQWKKRIDVILLSSTNKSVAEKVLSLLKKGSSTQLIKEKLNTKEVINVMVSESVYEEGAPALPKDLPFNEGISEIIKQGDYYYVAKINKIIPEGNKSLDECKGKVINEYQQYLEQNWVNELKKEFTIKVNQDVFEKIKIQLKK
jgi:peptidyl-prolyl cis-trans isomerase SurA